MKVNLLYQTLLVNNLCELGPTWWMGIDNSFIFILLWCRDVATQWKEYSWKMYNVTSCMNIGAKEYIGLRLY